MNTVKDALAQKSGALIDVRSGDMVVEALRQMRDNRVRSVLVIDDDVLVGIVTQGDCAIKVLLPGLDAKQNSGGPSDDGSPGDGQAGRPTGRLHGNDVCARHSPSTSAGRGQGRGRDLDRRRRQGHHPKFGAQRGRLDWLHHDGRPRGLTDEPRCCRRRPGGCINASGVFERLANPLTGCRNIGWPLAARNSSYYSTNIADRTESLRTEWRRTYPDGSCNFDLNGRHTVRRSKCRRALGRLGSAERRRQA